MWFYARRYPGCWMAGLLSLLLTTAFAAWIPWKTKQGIEALQSPDPVAAVVPVALAIVGLAVAQAFCRVLSRTIVYYAAREIEFELRNDLFRHLLQLPLSFYDRTPSGEVLSRAANDTSDIRMTLGAGFIQLLNTAFSLVAALGMMLALSPRLTAATAFLAPVLALCFRHLSLRNYTLSSEVQAGLAKLSAKVTENLTGLATIQAHGQEAREISEFEKLDARYRDDNLRLAYYRAGTWPVAGLVAGLATVVIILYGGALVLRGELGLGDFVAFQGYVGMLQWPMIGFGWILNVIQRGFAAIDRLQRLLAVESDIVEVAAPHPVPASLGEGLRIRDLHFRYPRAGLADQEGTREDTAGARAERLEDEAGTEVLRGVDLCIRPGERVALVGRIGAGKSTLVDLLVRLYPVPDGHITLGGVDINAMPVRALRAEFGFVPQDRFLFSRTLRENLLMGDPEAGVEKMERFSRIAQLEKDVLDFPQGYETLLGERGVTLSGGQRQRACLTRALLREPRIMVLDDTFSAVDTDTEEEILKALRERHEDAITLLITHRPSTMREADRICVMDQGRIVEEGSPDQLLAAGGLYAELVRTATLREQLGLEAGGEGA